MAKGEKSKAGKADKPAKKVKKADKTLDAKAAKPAAAKKPKKAKKAPAADVAGKAVKGFQALAQNPLVADVVAATLVSMAAALKDNKKAHQLAEGSGDQLKSASKGSGADGKVMWDLARDVGRQTLEALLAEQTKGKKGPKTR